MRFTPIKVRILDIIKARPGISRKEICYAVYDTVTEAKERTIAAHIYQIRDTFEESEMTVRAKPYGGYFIRKKQRWER